MLDTLHVLVAAAFLSLLHNAKCIPTQIYSKDGVYYAEEVQFGDTAVLRCRSNVKHYFLDYWFINRKNLVIGPANDDYDKGKYKYEILSGNLTIKAVNTEDAGDYYCVSRQVEGNKIYTQRTKLIVNYDWKHIEEHSSGINTIRIIISLIGIVLLGIAGYVVYTIWRDRYRHPRYLEQDDEDDDSAEEIFRAPVASTSGTSRPKSPIVKASKSDNFESISTDFTSILDTTNTD
ncbi:unnamed protein product [Acanthoscelides obtectus]|uniref:Ig-like domain-containing protein n=1 Tax=Acanthoscelides obtectus TaxID=200917 RepID=A0A9P0PC04_ACAOB|nr:unnamed protein product [Acanthoscelides obtectus]CAK1653774.1 hypothetical protein AOBTE_LOCUS18359 [Acanthoscelides obtectus]